jgi:hypothetical protein
LENPNIITKSTLIPTFFNSKPSLLSPWNSGLALDDQIALLHGSKTPAVLRERHDGYYVVLGGCYYDGAMYGEMADLNDATADILRLV